MISCPDAWVEFLELYYNKQLNQVAYSIKTRTNPLFSENHQYPVLNVDMKDLMVYQEGRILEELHLYPTTVLAHAKEALSRVTTIYDVSLHDCNIRFYNSPYKKHVKDILSDYVGKFTVVQGLVKRASTVYQVVDCYVVQCLGDDCGYQFTSNSIKGNTCPVCGSRKCEIVEKKLHDVQSIIIQDLPEVLVGREQPQKLVVFLEKDLLCSAKPGDKVEIYGVVGWEEDYGLYITANNVVLQSKELKMGELTQEDKEKILELSKDPNLFQRLTNSIAPSVFGHDDIKLAIVLQLFGSPTRKLPDGTTIRGDIHILLVGDPGTAKSQLIRYVHSLIPRSVYTSGKGVTGVGLTAAVVRDEVSGQWSLEAGALVLADMGIAVVDEIEKMDKGEHAALHEALEHQTISIAKAGIVATLNARTSLLAAANPKYGRFEQYTPLAEQINISPTLLSRFDLIFVVKDVADKDKDRKLIRHMLKTRSEATPDIDPDLLRKYIAYAKAINPVFSDEAMNEVEEYFVLMRSKAKDGALPITPRQGEAIIRLSMASARARLSEIVGREDVRRAIYLLEKALGEIAFDKDAEMIDINIIDTGISARIRNRIMIIKNIIEEEDKGPGAPLEKIIERAEESGISTGEVNEILNKLREMGEAFIVKMGYYKLVK